MVFVSCPAVSGNFPLERYVLEANGQRLIWSQAAIYCAGNDMWETAKFTEFNCVPREFTGDKDPVVQWLEGLNRGAGASWFGVC